MWRRSVRTSAFGLLTLVLAAVFAVTSALAQATAVQYSQGFETDGVWSPSSTVTRVPSGTGGVTSKSGSFHGQVGTNSTNWGGYSSVFPDRGYTTSVDVYLNLSAGYANATTADFSSAINDSSGNHRRDFIFSFGFYNDAVAPGTGNRFIISTGNNSVGNPRNPAGNPYVITSTGWYTLKHRFYNNAGILAVEMSLLDASGTTLSSWSTSDPSDVIGAAVGGNRYGWFPYNAFTSLPIDNSQRAIYLQSPSISVVPAPSPSATDNDYTRINNAVQYIADNGTITLTGTFNWTEANAAASWAKGSDGQAGVNFTNDDYSILVPHGLQGVNFTAPSPLGATIQGPGDLPAANLEGVLYFDGESDTPNWTLSNVRYLDFDLGIGMFAGSGGTDSYNGTKILNNEFLVARDLNATVAPIDVNQNIGIHYSFGTNQQISGNAINLHGDGVSAAPNYSTEVGMQSNTSGGNAYDGLLISNNTLHVLNASNPANPSRVRGIWENGQANTSSITINQNQFKVDVPSTNLVEGFWITSHSSPTSTVLYSNNLASGANVGFKWVGNPEYPGTDYSGNLPVVLQSNVMRSNATGVLVQGNGSATVRYNQIVGNSAVGIQNLGAGTVDAADNWWGCSYGPAATGPQCSVTTNGTLGSVSAPTWLTLRTSANPSPIVNGTTSNISSNLKFNQNNIDTSAGGTIRSNPVSFSATGGTVNPTNSGTTAGVATTTFTATSVGPATVTTVADGQSVTAGVVVVTSACNEISVPPTLTSITPGPVQVPISTDDVTGRGVGSYDIVFNYNSTTLQYTGFNSAGTLSSGMTVTVNSSTPGTLIISGFGNAVPYLSGSGVLLNLNFNVTGPIGSSSPLNFGSFTFNEGIPCTNTTNGNFNVISGTISGTVTYLNNSASRKVPGVVVSGAPTPTPGVAVSDATDANGFYELTGMGNTAYLVTPSKTGDVQGAVTAQDATRIAQHVVASNPFPVSGGAFESADVSGNGTITSFDASLVANYVVSLPAGSSGTWRFVPVNRSYTIGQVQSGLSGENYAAILMGDVTGNWGGAAAPTRPDQGTNPVVIAAPELSANSGTELTIPIAIDDTTGRDITSYQFDLRFDPTVLEPMKTAASVAGTLSASQSVVFNQVEPGLLKVAVYGITPLSGAGQLLNLRFNVIGPVESSSSLRWENFVINEGEVLFAVRDGRVDVSNASGNAVINGRVVTSMGTPIRNARVTLTNTRGQERSVVTSSFGMFQVGSLELGETYTVTVASKRYRFASQVLSMSGGAVNVEMIGQE